MSHSTEDLRRSASTPGRTLAAICDSEGRQVSTPTLQTPSEEDSSLWSLYCEVPTTGSIGDRNLNLLAFAHARRNIWNRGEGDSASDMSGGRGGRGSRYSAQDARSGRRTPEGFTWVNRGQSTSPHVRNTRQGPSWDD